MKTIHPYSILVAVLVFLPGLAEAADYYVDANHPQANDSNPGTAVAPWKTIAKANNTLAPGDTVFVKPGIYDTHVAPANSGSPSLRIAYESLGNVVVSNSTRGVYLVNRSYVTVRNFDFRYLDEFLRVENGSSNIIANCSFVEMRSVGGWEGSRIFNNSTHNQITNCVFAKWGYFTVDDDLGSVLDIGDEYSSTDQTRFNLLADCTLYHGGHHVLGVFGNRNVIRNNYIHNENWYNGYGNRNLYLHGYDSNSGQNLIEGNRIAFSGEPNDNVGASGMLLTTHSNIVRRNSFYQNGTLGISLSVTASYFTSPQYNRIYNNTFYQNGTLAGSNVGSEKKSGIAFAVYSGTRTITANAIVNNVFALNPKPYGTYMVNLSDQLFVSNWEQTGDPLFVNAPTVLDPWNAGLPDFRLRSDSPCIDRGSFVTKVTSSSASGLAFQVHDASYFMDGWSIVEGDIIQLQGTGQRARITKIDYMSKMITVATSLTWTQNQGVALAYAGTAPDMGAYEYQNLSVPPGITSGLAASGSQGQPFNYQIAATGNPTSFGATGLPAGLAVATNSGTITGTPATSGVFTSTISALNQYGTGSANLTITIVPPSPFLSVSPGRLTFAEIGTGQTADLQLWVTNTGIGTLIGTASTVAPFSVVSGASYSITNGQIWPVMVRYSPTSMGSHSGSVVFTGGGGSSRQLEGQAFPVFSSWSFPSTTGLVMAPFTTNTGYLVQGIETDGDPIITGSGRAVYGFTITNAGNYLISAYVNAPDGSANSLYVNIDAEPADPIMNWNIPLTVGFERRTASWWGTGGAEFIPKVFSLTTGVHKLVLRGREAGVRLDRIEITRSGAPAPPTNLRIITGN